MVAITDALIRQLSGDDTVITDLKNRGLLSGDFSQQTASSADEQLSNILARGLALQAPTGPPIVPIEEGAETGAIVGGEVTPEISAVAGAIRKQIPQQGEGEGFTGRVGGPQVSTGDIAKALSALPGSVQNKLTNLSGAQIGGIAANVGKNLMGLTGPAGLAVSALGRGVGAAIDVSRANTALEGGGLTSELGLSTFLSGLLPFGDTVRGDFLTEGGRQITALSGGGNVLTPAQNLFVQQNFGNLTPREEDRAERQAAERQAQAVAAALTAATGQDGGFSPSGGTTGSSGFETFT